MASLLPRSFLSAEMDVLPLLPARRVASTERIQGDAIQIGQGQQGSKPGLPGPAFPHADSGFGDVGRLGGLRKRQALHLPQFFESHLFPSFPVALSG